MHTLKKKSVLVNTGNLFLENILRLVVGAFLSFWMARSLGPEGYGYFSFLISFTSIFATIVVFGNEDLLIKDLNQDAAESHLEIMSAAFLMRFFGAIISFLMSLMFFYYFYEDKAYLLGLVVVLSLANALKLFQAADYYFMGMQNITKVVKLRNITFIFLSIVKFYFLVSGFEFQFFVYISAIEVSLFSLISFYLYSRNGAGFQFTENVFLLLKKMSLASFPLMLVSFSVVASSKIDQLMILNFYNADVLGQYSVSVKLIELLGFVPAVLASTYLPLIMSGNAEQRDYRFSYLFGALFTISCTVFIVFSLSSKYVIPYVFGAQYEYASQILPFYTLLLILNFFLFAQQRYILATSRTVFILIVVLLSLLLNVLFNWIFIPLHGVYGAIGANVLAVVVSQIIAGIFMTEVRTSLKMLIRGVKIFFCESFLHKKLFP